MILSGSRKLSQVECWSLARVDVMTLPLSAARKMRIFCSVVCLLPFMVWAFLLAQTNIASGPDFGGAPQRY